jgi:two-component system, OmpR family, response regulator
MNCNANTVAVVDDIPDAGEIMSMLLTEFCSIGQVRLFRSGKEFLARLRRHAFSVILLDLVMPDMSGYDVIKAIHKIDPGARVIALTGYRGERSRALSAGFSEFVTKPITDIEALCRLLQLEA